MTSWNSASSCSRRGFSTGTADRIVARAADALVEACEDLLDRVRGSTALNMDETGWRLRGQQRALWGMFTDRHAILQVAPGRHEDHAKNLLANSTAIVTSDRWWAYNHLPVKRRQVCWSHLKRDFAFHAEGLDADRQLGELGSRICRQLFDAWDTFRQTRDRRQLQVGIRRLRRELKPILREYSGKAPRYKRCRGLARNLLKVWPALWTFADHPGVQPTNNHAERGLRGAVIHRKLSLGSQSETGRHGSPGCSPRIRPAAFRAAACTDTSWTCWTPRPAATPSQVVFCGVGRSRGS